MTMIMNTYRYLVHLWEFVTHIIDNSSSDLGLEIYVSLKCLEILVSIKFNIAKGGYSDLEVNDSSLIRGWELILAEFFLSKME